MRDIIFWFLGKVSNGSFSREISTWPQNFWPLNCPSLRFRQCLAHFESSLKNINWRVERPSLYLFHAIGLAWQRFLKSGWYPNYLAEKEYLIFTPFLFWLLAHWTVTWNTFQYMWLWTLGNLSVECHTAEDERGAV